MSRYENVRDVMGLTNVRIMVPFVRPVGEGQAVVELLGGRPQRARMALRPRS